MSVNNRAGELPPKVRPTQWLSWAVLQAWFTPAGIYAYADMTGPTYHLGNWALLVAIPCLLLPTLYGIGLVHQTLQRSRQAERLRKAYARPLSPTCGTCQTNPRSWNTRTGSWMETCSGCRGNSHPDSGYLIG